jgi:hypothetical protein
MEPEEVLRSILIIVQTRNFGRTEVERITKTFYTNMKGGTKIQYKGSEYNEDGDRPVNFDNIPTIKSTTELKSAIDDLAMHFMHITDAEIYGINK